MVLRLFVALAVALAVFVTPSLACAFAKRGGELPSGHKPLSSSCPNSAPGVPYLDGAVGEAHTWVDLPYDDFYIARVIANLSVSHATSLCYWSQQVLPSPPTGTDPSSGNCTWPSVAVDADDVMSVYSLATQAIARMHSMQLYSTAFLGSTCGGGSSNTRAVCVADPTSIKCTPALLSQRSVWAVASNIVRIDADTLPVLIANDTQWRTSAAWHIPAMGSAQVQKGWGIGGVISFKVLPCAVVPPTLLGVAYDCDLIDPATGKPVWDEAFSWWQTYVAPAWLTRGLRDALVGRL